MKSTPIYILLLIFFLNFDLAWATLWPESDHKNLIHLQFAYRQSKDISISSINYTYLLNTIQLYERNNVTHKLRFNFGLSRILAELDYEIGNEIELNRNITFLPYLSFGTNIYAVSYGAGMDIDYRINRKLGIVANINYRANEKLIGYTDAQQWYQSGFGAKIGVEFFYSIKRIEPPIDW